MKLSSAVLLTIGLALPAMGSASVINLGPSATAFGSHTPSSQSVPAGVQDNSASFSGNYYGSTDDVATGYYYFYWGAPQQVQTVRYIGSLQDSSRKLVDFTVKYLVTGGDHTNPADWVNLFPAVTGNSSLQINFERTNPVTTQGVKVEYANQFRPLTGELEVFDSLLPTPPATVTASPDIFGAAAAATDGQTLTSYGSSDLGGGTGFVALDFGSDKIIQGFRVRFRVQGGYYNATQDFALQRWDGSNWVNILTQTNWGASSELFEVNLPSLISTSQVRLLAITPRSSPNFAGGSLGLFDFEAIEYIPEPGVAGVMLIGGAMTLLRRCSSRR